MMRSPLRTTSLAAACFGAAACVSLAQTGLSASPTPASPPANAYRLPGEPGLIGSPGAGGFGIAPLARGPRDTSSAPAATNSATPEPSAREAAAKPAEPQPDIEQPEGRRKILDDLFARMRNAQDRDESRFLAAAIQRVWLRSGSDTADLLMGRATQTMQAQNYKLATDLLDKIIELSPDWAEGWNKRATVRFLADDYPGAIEDIAHTLALEPRHFGALRGLGDMLVRMDMKKQALRAYRAAMDLNPRQENLRKMIEQMASEVEGHDI